MSIRPRLAVAAVLAAAGFAAGGYFLWPKGRDLACAAHATVPAAAVQKLAAYAGRIEHDVQHSSDGLREESWFDSATGNRRQVSFDRDGKITNVFVDVRQGPIERTAWLMYRGRTWQSTASRTPVRLDPNPAATTAQASRDLVFSHRARIVGREANSIHLHQTLHIPMPKLPSGATLTAAMRRKIARTRTAQIDTWVDPVTYVTRRVAFRNGGDSSTTNETWLPRTPENVAQTRLVVPAGFRRVYPQHGSLDVVLSKFTRRC